MEEDEHSSDDLMVINSFIHSFIHVFIFMCVSGRRFRSAETFRVQFGFQSSRGASRLHSTRRKLLRRLIARRARSDQCVMSPGELDGRGRARRRRV